MTEVERLEKLREAAREFLRYHALDCGAHRCRYCAAGSPNWNHDDFCLYVRSQAAYTALSAALAEAPAREEEPPPPREEPR